MLRSRWPTTRSRSPWRILLEEPHVARVEPVVAARDDDPLAGGWGRRNRDWGLGIRNCGFVESPPGACDGASVPIPNP